jgi:hypothetical protein
MAEVLRVFDEPLLGPDGRRYVARVCGAERQDGMWEGWLEFDCEGAVARTARETTQSRRAALAYWASGLTTVYADGALARALEPPRLVAVPDVPEPTFDGPAAKRLTIPLDQPLAKAEDELLSELLVLDPLQLVDIVVANGLAATEHRQLARLSKAELIELILERTRGTVRAAKRP